MAELEHLILDHLVAAPGAGDTARGIAEWWLLQQHIRSAVSDVRNALDALVKDGWVRELRQSDGVTRYRVREDRLHEIELLLRGQTATKSAAACTWPLDD